jgi:hypothetical protein
MIYSWVDEAGGDRHGERVKTAGGWKQKPISRMLGPVARCGET